MPVKYVGYDLLNRYGMIHKFKVPSATLETFLSRIEEGMAFAVLLYISCYFHIVGTIFNDVRNIQIFHGKNFYSKKAFMLKWFYEKT